MKFLLTLAILGAFSSTAQAAAAGPAFNKGTYNFTGAVAATNNNCTFQVGNAVGGYMIYPGAGKTGFAWALPLFTAPAQVTIVNGLPAVQAGGLNGWKANGTLTSFTNGAVSQGPLAVSITFNAFVAVANNAGQASVTFSAPGACSETFNVTFLRTGDT